MSGRDLPTVGGMRWTAEHLQKPSSRLKDRMAAKKAEADREGAFRRAVWARDEGKCQVCGVKVIKTLALDPKRGEVHHRRGRNVAPEHRYAVDQALLLCLSCHQKAHAGEIKIPKVKR